MFAREGTSEGVWMWPMPCRAMKAIGWPEGSEAKVMGDDGAPQGVVSLIVLIVVRPVSL